MSPSNRCGTLVARSWNGTDGDVAVAEGEVSGIRDRRTRGRDEKREWRVMGDVVSMDDHREQSTIDNPGRVYVFPVDNGVAVRAVEPGGSSCTMIMDRAQVLDLVRRLSLASGGRDTSLRATLLLGALLAGSWWLAAGNPWFLFASVPLSLFAAFAHAGAGRR